MALMKVVFLLAFVTLVIGDHCSKYQCLLGSMSWKETVSKDYRLKIVTVATEENDAFLRFMRSAKVFNLDVEVFGLDEKWRDDDRHDTPGGSRKLASLKRSMEKYKNEKKLVLLFTDSSETIFTAGKSVILNKFKNTGANILISRDDYCWPDRSMKARYLVRERDHYRYLCSAGIIGYAPHMYKMLSLMWREPTADNQPGYRHMFLDERKKYGIKWDRRHDLFQVLNGFKEVVVLNFTNTGFVKLTNTGFGTTPAVIHGTGPSKVHLTYLGNYVPHMWSPKHGCTTCEDDVFHLQKLRREQWPKIFFGIFINIHTPLVETFLDYISELDYPKEKIDVFIHNVMPEHDRAVNDWLHHHGDEYYRVMSEGSNSNLTNRQARDLGIVKCKKYNCDYYFSIDSIVSLTYPQTLQILLRHNKSFIAPMVTQPNKFWKSNFWGDHTVDGRYIRSVDYLDITNRRRVGIWNMPYVRDVYLIKRSVLDRLNETPFESEDYTPYFQFSTYLRDIGVFMYISNLDFVGYLKDMKDYQIIGRHTDLFQHGINPKDWLKKYIHPDAIKNLHNLENLTFEQPCTDVFMFPLVSRTFCDHVIDESEHVGKWIRDGQLSGGYEHAVTFPVKQLGYEDIWRSLLEKFVSPIVEKVFSGYKINFESKIINMVSKQWRTQKHYPHYDDPSAFTLTLALNEGGYEYQGGGQKFTRYNCTLRHPKLGWASIRPGTFTHKYENLEVTEGTKYILVSLIDAW